MNRVNVCTIHENILIVRACAHATVSVDDDQERWRFDGKRSVLCGCCCCCSRFLVCVNLSRHSTTKVWCICVVGSLRLINDTHTHTHENKEKETYIGWSVDLASLDVFFVFVFVAEKVRRKSAHRRPVILQSCNVCGIRMCTSYQTIYSQRNVRVRCSVLLFCLFNTIRLL